MQIIVKILEQKLYLYSGQGKARRYSVSTSKYGVGNRSGSNKTPLGLHRIAGKFGRNARPGAIFKRRRNTGRVALAGTGGDLITTRILRLEGVEKGINKGRGIDSLQRCIYIHGTPQEHLIGRPASCGCIRMRNSDIVDLFGLVKRGALVKISK